MVICLKLKLGNIINALIFSLLAWPMIATPSRADDGFCQIPLVEMILMQDFGRAFFCAGERLELNPNDTEARLIFARAAQETGQFEIAVSFANRARQYQISKADRFASYLISGLARAGQGKFISANLDLRRGSDFAVSEVEKKIIRQAIASIGAMSPWRYVLGFSVEPSTNVNAGSMHDTMTWFGSTATISEDGQAQSGTAYTGNASIHYIKPISATLYWENMAGVSATTYDGPGRNNVEYSLTSGLRYSPKGNAASLVYGYVTHDKRFIAETTGSEGFRNFEPYYRQTTLGVEYHQILDADFTWEIYTSYTDRISNISSTQDAQISSIGGNFSLSVNDETSLTLGGYWRDTASNSADIAALAGNLSIGVDWASVDWPVTVSGELDYTHTDFKTRIFGYTGKRADDNVSLELVLALENIQFYGFNPNVGVNWTRNYSNLNRYDTETVQAFTRLTTSF